MNQAKVAAIFLTGVAIGGVGVYWAAVGTTKQKYEAILEREIEDVKSHYRHIHVKDKYDSPQDRLQDVTEEKDSEVEYIKKVSQYEIETERAAEDTSVKLKKAAKEERSIFDYTEASSGKSPRGETEENKVTSTSPYPVTYEEFDGENTHYSKTTLTYFRGDDTVADEQDDIVTNVEELLGEAGLSSFGHDPDHPDTAYIRNDKLQADYEVLLEERGYDEVVVG